MGNQHAHDREEGKRKGAESGNVRVRSGSAKTNSVCLIKLFQKLELTADEQNRHPGELSRTTFENAFHGPLHKFGKLLYQQMVSHGHGSSIDRERITKEQFTKAGRALLKMFDDSAQLQYYFKLFAAGKDYLTKDDALQMINVSYALTLSASMIAYSKGSFDDSIFQGVVEGMVCTLAYSKGRFDDSVFQGVVEGIVCTVAYSMGSFDDPIFQAVGEGLFGINEKLSYEDFTTWTKKHSPHLFCGVHNWVYQILTGSKMPSELETAPVPQLERFVEDKYTMCMGMLWMLTTVIPQAYTHTPEDKPKQAEKQSEKNPLLNSFHMLMKLAQLTRCQSWTLLYDSREHGLSHNRFHHHISSYQGPSIMLISFEGRNIYCFALDKQWREGSSRFGGENTMLIQISPVFRVVQAAGPMAIWNEYSRDIKKGIHIGKDGKNQVLFIPADFDTVEHYGVQCALDKLEVWGCGSIQILEAQVKQKQWEKKETEKQASKKLHLDVGKWEENPDKQILQWGGINVEHQYSRDGGF